MRRLPRATCAAGSPLQYVPARHDGVTEVETILACKASSDAVSSEMNDVNIGRQERVGIS